MSLRRAWFWVVGLVATLILAAGRGLAWWAEGPATAPALDPAAPARECGRAAGLGPKAAGASHGSGGFVMHCSRVVLVDRVGMIRAYHVGTEGKSMDRPRVNLHQLLDVPPAGKGQR